MLVGFALVPDQYSVVLTISDRQLAISQRVTIKHGKDARIIHTYIYSKALSNFHGWTAKVNRAKAVRGDASDKTSAIH